MAFNRYEILTNHYKKQIQQLDFSAIQKALVKNAIFDSDGQNILGLYWLGTTLGVMPSGKIYAPWTTNQTRADVIKDQCFIEALEEIADENGLFVHYDDDSISFAKCLELDEVETFNTSDDEELAREFFAE